jgi:hypothetical protein
MLRPIPGSRAPERSTKAHSVGEDDDQLMDLAAKVEFLRRAIASQQTTLRVQTSLAAALFSLGVTAVVLAFVRPDLLLPESLKGGQSLGGALIGVSGFVPIFASRRDKVAALHFLLTGYERQWAEAPNAEDVKKLDLYFDQYFGKILGG